VFNWSHAGLVIVVVISCFYAAAYFSLRNFSRLRLEEVLAKQNKLNRLSYLQEHIHNFLLTCSIIRTSANLALVTIMVWVMTKGSLTVFGLAEAFLISLILLSIFSVALPHAWARYASEGILARTIPLLKISEKILLPVLGVMHGIDVIVRRLSGASIEPEDEDEHVQQEILEAVQEGQNEGVVGIQERKMIESVIELRTIDVGQIMTPRTEIVAIDAGDSIDKIKKTIMEHGHSRMPVYDDNLDNIIGMLYVKDLLPLLGEDLDGFDLRTIMRQCYFVPETKNLRDIFAEFRSKKVHVAIVLDEYGGTLGLVTFEDVIEQIVGQVADEYEQVEQPLVRQIDATTLELDGRTRIDELNDEYPVELPESDDYETVSGFLFSSLGRIPDSGETFQYQNLLFTVLDATERKINQVRLEILPTTETVTSEHSNGKKSRGGN
jgi:CBS domain containing-hemolysin-like protein